MYYSVFVVVSGKNQEGYLMSRDMPTILLDGDSLGITGEAHAEKIVRSALTNIMALAQQTIGKPPELHITVAKRDVRIVPNSMPW